jgi:hypothetical protein
LGLARGVVLLLRGDVGRCIDRIVIDAAGGHGELLEKDCLNLNHIVRLVKLRVFVLRTQTAAESQRVSHRMDCLWRIVNTPVA